MYFRVLTRLHFRRILFFLLFSSFHLRHVTILPLYSALSEEMERVVSHQYISVGAHCNCSTFMYMNLPALEESGHFIL